MNRFRFPIPYSPFRWGSGSRSGLTSILVVLFATFLFTTLQGQVVPLPGPGSNAVTVVASEDCGSSRLYAALAGRGYRTLWTTPIQVPVADLGTLGGGGLSPLRVGGGMTTQTLHLRGADGRRYVFRSVRKETRRALDEEFWGTPVEGVYQDQLCSFHPTGAVIVARLLEAVGVLHPTPQFLVVPDDPRLGEFREQFAGMLVLFEERPDDLPDGQAGFGGSRRITQTEDFFDDLEEHAHDRIDRIALLKSRLVDLLVGDRDRSINNYLWARYDEGDEGHSWEPVPRDRDQSFVRFDGTIKKVVRWYDPRLVSFTHEDSDIMGLTRNAWDIDRNLLVGLDRETWDSTVSGVKEAISDDVIAEAVRRMPEEHIDLVGDELEATLRGRRDRLSQAAAGLYRIVFREADVHASDEDEVAVLTRTAGGDLHLSVHHRGPDSEPEGPPHFQRTFSSAETKELRLYLHGGDDLARIEGAFDSPILVRIVGGGGDDELSDTSGTGNSLFYDDGGDTRVGGSGTKLVRKNAPRPYTWWVNSERELDFGSRSWPQFSVSYDSDRGFFFSGGLKRESYGFLKDPFSQRLQVKMGWAVGRAEPLADYRHYFQDVVGGSDLQVRARYSGFEIVRFYGLGNETEQSEAKEFYEVQQKQLELLAALSFGDGEGRQVSLGPVFRRTSSDTTNSNTFVSASRAYGTGTFQQAGLRLTVDLDERDLVSAPTRGFHLSAGASYYPEVLDVESSFGEVHGEAAGYLSPGSGNPTLAVRLGGKRLWGTFPYSDAAFIGGTDNVRGLLEQRFAGDAAVYGSAEIRLFLTRFRIVFPYDLGVFGLTDTGRVFLDGEPSGTWHNSIGGGIWLAPVTRAATVQLSFAESGGRRAFYVGMGFAY